MVRYIFLKVIFQDSDTNVKREDRILINDNRYLCSFLLNTSLDKKWDSAQCRRKSLLFSNPLKFKKLWYCWADIDGSLRFSREKQDFV